MTVNFQPFLFIQNILTDVTEPICYLSCVYKQCVNQGHRIKAHETNMHCLHSYSRLDKFAQGYF